MNFDCASSRNNQSGFTFAEVLAAMLFLAILIPAVVEGISLANRAAVTAERQSVALQLGEHKLNQLLLDENPLSSGSQGDFGNAYPLYSWKLDRSTWREDSMTQLTLRVAFTVQGRQREVSLTTLIDETATEE
ncbi:MAG: type IV pilus modification PilV family protein [Limisphaerales bacterium]|jgi:Tfp pilus assembly protein PilV